MKVEIFDVALGQCAVITCPDSRKIMIDVGHKTGEWRPSEHFSGHSFEAVFIGNYDHDHTSDLVDVMRRCKVWRLIGNPTIGSAALSQLKYRDGMGSGIQYIYEWLKTTDHLPEGLKTPQFDLGEVLVNWFWKPYEFGDKSNNLSVATFVRYRGFTILFPGDLEGAGWDCMLRNPTFRELFASTNVLVAAHHGRDNGRCLDMLTFCKPDVVIISDAGKQHATQETVDWYAYRTAGRKTRDGRFRKVLTTRSSGKITLDIDGLGQCHISTSHNDAFTPRPPAINYATAGLPALDRAPQVPVGGIRLSDIARYGIGEFPPQFSVPGAWSAASAARYGLLGQSQPEVALSDLLSRPNPLARGLLDFVSPPRQAIPEPTNAFMAALLRER